MKEVAESISNTDNGKIKLMIVGEGDLYEPLLRMRSKKNLDGILILTGKVPFGDIPKYLAAADICLLPAYKNEIMMNIVPIKVYEYMAMGKPVIATALPGDFENILTGCVLSFNPVIEPRVAQWT